MNKNLYMYARSAEKTGGFFGSMLAFIKYAASAYAAIVDLIAIVGQAIFLSGKREYMNEVATKRNILLLSITLVLIASSTVLSFVGKRVIESITLAAAAIINLISNYGMLVSMKQYFIRFGAVSIVMATVAILTFVLAVIDKVRVRKEYKHLCEKLELRLRNASPDGIVSSSDLEKAMNEYRGK